MDQQEYLQAIDEMTIPASKILAWANLIKNEYYSLYYDENRKYSRESRELFDKVLAASQKMVSLIPKIRSEIQAIKSETYKMIVFTHTLAGPIASIKGYTELLLSFPFWKPETEQSDSEIEHILYLRKINSAAEYLWSLDRDASMKLRLDNPDN
jgi:hypothetical protein